MRVIYTGTQELYVKDDGSPSRKSVHLFPRKDGTVEKRSFQDPEAFISEENAEFVLRHLAKSLCIFLQMKGVKKELVSKAAGHWSSLLPLSSIVYTE
jgi:hypothetical protein